MTRISDLRAAYDGQLAALAGWLRALPVGVEETQSRLPGWTVGELAFHTTEVPQALLAALAAPPPGGRPMSIAAYTASWRTAAAEIESRERAGAQGVGVEDVIERHLSAAAALHRAFDAAGTDPVVAGRRGPIRASDFLVTRVNELVVHSLDLSASLPELEPVAIDRAALGVACRMLAAILAERAPGRTVEVRVPPYAAVQCIAGPRHTRGTPANVVEADAVTWVELATGRTTWSEALAAGSLTASGERADISEQLPVLS
jgi:uncharacterized protein (TIGR03083 family)